MTTWVRNAAFLLFLACLAAEPSANSASLSCDPNWSCGSKRYTYNNCLNLDCDEEAQPACASYCENAFQTSPYINWCAEGTFTSGQCYCVEECA